MDDILNIVLAENLKTKVLTVPSNANEEAIQRKTMLKIFDALESSERKSAEPRTLVPFPKLNKEQRFIYAFLRPIYLASHNVNYSNPKLFGPYTETYYNREHATYIGTYRDGKKFGFGKLVA